MGENLEWRRKYAWRLTIVDACIVLWATLGAFLIRFGVGDQFATEETSVAYAVFAIVLAVVWWVMLGAWGSRNSTILGSGTDEYKRIASASLWLFGLIAVLSYTFKVDTARGFVGLALPAGLGGLLLSRWLIRQHLTLERGRGASSSRVMVVGSPYAAEHLARSLSSRPSAGYSPVAVYLPGASAPADLPDGFDIPVAGYDPTVASIITAIRFTGVDAVAISAGVNLRPLDLRRLGWELAALNVSMILAPALTDVAGPRIHTQPVAGLPLIHVSTPKLTGGKKVAKRAFDIAGAGSLLLLAAPVLAVLAVLTKMSSPGPVFYTQERVGLRATTFNMVKFRSMVTGADLQLSGLLLAQGSADKPLFKIENDPRITPVGRILRKYSLDELPQLFNVLTGSMSLVGPRPQRDGEVALYDDDARRRLYVQPGMSGLWQVSGRSNLSWEESIRLDLYYVENWSLMSDLVILFKTFKAVFASTGAV
ncbi:sugar transferase [Arthrobacter sp. A5]|uniref:sugar transferase n=1 Tax=Arthrobacter sp. A5 TaxID=576926 RepID=UPI003DA86F10